MREAPAEAQQALDSPEIRRRLAEIRCRGYEIAPSYDVVGVTDIACPVLLRNGVALASIGVTYLNRRRAAIRPEEVVERLRETCRTISAEIADLPGGAA